MTIILKNKETLLFEDFVFKCSIGKRGTTKSKIEGDKKTPKGLYSLGYVFFRKDRLSKPITNLKTFPIKKNMAWCNDINNKKKYNKLINTKEKTSYEKLYRKDHKYDLLITINYNTKNTKIGKGSAIFIHLTKNYEATLGCIALKKKDLFILLKIIKKKTKIKIT